MDGFQENVKLLKERGGYLGRINLHTGEVDDYKLGHLLDFKGKDFLADYFKLAEAVVMIERNDLKNPKKMKSHTATVSYHAIKGNYYFPFFSLIKKNSFLTKVTGE